MTSREAFAAWSGDQLLKNPDSMIFDKGGLSLAWEVWQAATERAAKVCEEINTEDDTAQTWINIAAAAIRKGD
jgi:hypothetical protein